METSANVSSNPTELSEFRSRIFAENCSLSLPMKIHPSPRCIQTRTTSSILAIICLWLTLALLPSARAATNSVSELRVATYNLRFASATGENSWPERRPLMKEVIHSMNPDVFGTQEGLHDQLQDIAKDSPDYQWIGRGRNADGGSEYMAVFYRTARLQPLSTNHFWLSDTPEVPGSTTWGNSNRRMVTWIKFRDRDNGKEFYFFNTHFDHQIQMAREKSAELLRTRVGELGTNLPIILTGDFNAGAGQNKAYSILTDDGFFKDTWTESPTRIGGSTNSFNGFRTPKIEGERIDWILTRGAVKTESAEIVTLQPHGQFASDHFPVLTKLLLK